MEFTFDWSVIANFMPVLFFSALAFWKENHILFLITFGIAVITGLNCPDIIAGHYETTAIGVTVGACLLAYSFFCLGMAVRLMFWKGESGEQST